MACTRQMSTVVVKALRTNKIIDNADEQIISIALNSDSAKVLYEKDGNVYDLVHSDIPDKYQGQGLGHILAERVFDHLISNKKKIKLSCEFLQRYYVKNLDKYKDYVVN